MLKLRDYQQACIDLIEAKPPGSYLIQMATGLGKTKTFTHIPRRGRVLILSHREELVRQPLKEYDCPTGVEMAGECAPDNAQVISASVASMVKRLERYDPGAFDTIIVDEAHHAGALTYRKILGYFRPRLTLGFTATPNRADKVRLDDVFQEIIFQRDLRWGIENGYLCDIHCLRANIGYDLTAVRTRNGDYAPGELEEAMDGTADAIAQAYREYARGATLIFAVSVHQAEEIAGRIPGAVVVTGKTKNRADIIARFTRREIPVIVNVMVFSEGTDMPLVETVIIARPTQSDALYTQMVGRGLRLHPEKDKLTLIDCVGVTGKASLCTAPSLLGIDLSAVPEKKRQEVQGDLFELPAKALAASDCPESWIRNVEIVDLWAKEMKYNLHGVNWFRLPDERMICCLPDGRRLTLPAPDSLGFVELGGVKVEYQTALDRAYRLLAERYEDSRRIWDLDQAKGWGRKPATEAQKRIISRKYKDLDVDGLTRLQASQVLNRMYGGRK